MCIFGIGDRNKPAEVKNFAVKRKQDCRKSLISWRLPQNRQGYHRLWEIAPDKFYHSQMIQDADWLEMRNLNSDQSHYFSIADFNENGVSEKTAVIKK